MNRALEQALTTGLYVLLLIGTVAAIVVAMEIATYLIVNFSEITTCIRNAT